MTHIVLSSHYYKTAPKPGFLVDFIIEASFDGIGRENDGYAMIPGMITGYDWMILQKALLYIYNNYRYLYSKMTGWNNPEFIKCPILCKIM